MSQVDITIQGDSTSAVEAFKQLDEAVGQTEGSGKQLDVGLANLEMGMAAVKEGLRMVSEAYDATIGKTLEYAKSVQELSREIGANSEESSKLIAVSNDLGISSETLSQSLGIAAKKGIDVTVEGLGNLADKYNSIQDPLQRTKFLMDEFGRGGRQLAEMMALGSDGIKKLGDQASITGLVLSDKDVEAAAKARLAFAQLQDVMTGLTVTLSNSVIPTLTAAAQAAELLFTWNTRLTGGIKAHSDQLAVTTMSQADYTAEVKRSAEAAGMELDAQGNLTQGMYVNGQWVQKLVLAHVLLNDAERESAKGAGDLADRLNLSITAAGQAVQATNIAASSDANLADEEKRLNEVAADRLQAMGDQYMQYGPISDAQEKLTNDLIAERYAGEAATQATRDHAQALQDTQNAMSVLNEEIAGPLQSENTKYTDTITQQKDQLAQLTEELKKHTAGWAEYTTAGQGVVKQIGDIKTAIQDEATAHENATRRILFGIVEQQVAQGNYGAQGALFLTQLATQWGLVDKASGQFTQTVITGLSKVATDGNWTGFLGNLDTARLKTEGYSTAAITAFQTPQDKIVALNNGTAFHDLSGHIVGIQTDTENLGTANTNQATAQQDALKAQVDDPSWGALHARYDAMIAKAQEFIDKLNKIPANITTTITTKYVTQGSPAGYQADGQIRMGTP